MPGVDGLLHVSEIANYRVKDVRDELKEGEQIMVKVINIDPSGKVRLSRKALLAPDEGTAPRDPRPVHDAPAPAATTVRERARRPRPGSGTAARGGTEGGGNMVGRAGRLERPGRSDVPCPRPGRLLGQARLHVSAEEASRAGVSTSGRVTRGRSRSSPRCSRPLWRHGGRGWSLRPGATFDVVGAAATASRVSGNDRAEIRVTQNDLVRVNFSAEDIPHSFTIEDHDDSHYRIMRRAEPGKPVSFDFRADTPGRFRFYCSLTTDPEVQGDAGHAHRRSEAIGPIRFDQSQS